VAVDLGADLGRKPIVHSGKKKSRVSWSEDWVENLQLKTSSARGTLKSIHRRLPVRMVMLSSQMHSQSRLWNE
jgi:hypothetical protein